MYNTSSQTLRSSSGDQWLYFEKAALNLSGTYYMKLPFYSLTKLVHLLWELSSFTKNNISKFPEDLFHQALEFNDCIDIMICGLLTILKERPFLRNLLNRQHSCPSVPCRMKTSNNRSIKQAKGFILGTCLGWLYQRWLQRCVPVRRLI